MADNVYVTSISEEKISVISVSNDLINVISIAEPLISVVSAGQGLQGAAGLDLFSGYLAKTLVYSGVLLVEILLYSDAEKTNLAERRVLSRNTDGNITEIKYYNREAVLTKTRILAYNAGQLVSVIDI